jgi:hypothetical protein
MSFSVAASTIARKSVEESSSGRSSVTGASRFARAAGENDRLEGGPENELDQDQARHDRPLTHGRIESLI